MSKTFTAILEEFGSRDDNDMGNTIYAAMVFVATCADEYASAGVITAEQAEAISDALAPMIAQTTVALAINDPTFLGAVSNFAPADAHRLAEALTENGIELP